jgi:hypothetical protein
LSRLGNGERNLSRFAGQRPEAERAGASESIQFQRIKVTAKGDELVFEKK